MSKTTVDKENINPQQNDDEEESTIKLRTRNKQSGSLIFKPAIKNVPKTSRKRKMSPMKNDVASVSTETNEVNNNDEDQTMKRMKLYLQPCQLTDKQKRTYEVKQSLHKFEQYVKSSKDILHFHCEYLRNEIDVQTEKLNKSIKEYYSSLTAQLEKYEKSCYKRIVQRAELRKYDDLIHEIKEKLSEIANNENIEDKEDDDELSELYERLNRAKEDYKRHIFCNKEIKFDRNEPSGKDFNPIGSFRETCYYRNVGLNIKRLLEDNGVTADENNNNLEIDDGDSKGIVVSENVTINKKRLTLVYKIENIYLTNIELERLGADEHIEKFICGIDYDKVILCKKFPNRSECIFKIIDIHCQQAKGLIFSEFHLKNFDLLSLKANNQFIFVMGKKLKLENEDVYVLEKYDQEFSLYNRVELNGKPVAMACNQVYVFVLIKESTGSYLIEAYSCENLNKFTNSTYAIDFEEELIDADMFINDEKYFVIILNKKFCLKFSTVVEANNSFEKIEIKLLNNFQFNISLKNYYVDSILNLLFVDISEINSYNLNERRFIKQFLVNDIQNDEKLIVTNDGYFALFKNDFSLEVY